MFDGLVDHYDRLNRLLSWGLDRRWRAAACRSLDLAPGSRVLDLGCGSGDLSLALTPRFRVVGLDISERMLRLAARRLAGRAALLRGSVFQLPFPAAAFDGLVSGFVLRNLYDLPAAFAEMARVVAPGGRVALLDAVEPGNPLVRRLFDAYFGRVAPALGALVGQRRAYQYLVRSLAHLPPPRQLCRLLEEAGFSDCRARPLQLGAVTLLTAARRSASEGSES